ncbi:hypothetical protein KPL49_19750 [Clostridium estertheticum]|nr:hypothetical protein [Clostridium estertheticum]
MNSVQTNGATFKSMGLNLQQSITLLAQFEQNGVNADTAMTGLQKARNRECQWMKHLVQLLIQSKMLQQKSLMLRVTMK